jgi:peptidoglycan hydrolase-like amidase
MRGMVKCGSLFILLACHAHAQQEIRVAVLSLFHSSEIVLEQGGSQLVSVTAGGANFVLNGEPGHRRLLFRAKGDRVMLNGFSNQQWKATGRDGSAVLFELGVPGKIHRAYLGRLTMEAHQGELTPIVSMDREIAVASIVAAEMDGSAPMEALKAQAVVTRSFLSAGSRHLNYDFCDTTHCQFLRSPPDAGSRASLAVEATHGMILVYDQGPIAAMYSSRCGGQTQSLRDVGMDPGEGYPYFSVKCDWCRAHPFPWRSRISGTQPPAPRNEKERIAAARLWGWGAIPGDNFAVSRDKDGWLIEGRGLGHGVGMCQFGAVGMAASGASYREILGYYYPNSELVTKP